jgi:hypothetical protein
VQRVPSQCILWKKRCPLCSFLAFVWRHVFWVYYLLQGVFGKTTNWRWTLNFRVSNFSNFSRPCDLIVETFCWSDNLLRTGFAPVVSCFLVCLVKVSYYEIFIQNLNLNQDSYLRFWKFSRVSNLKVFLGRKLPKNQHKHDPWFK